MTKRIALVGAAGRMGLEIVRAAQNNNDVIIGAAIEYDGSPQKGKDIGELAGIGNIGVSVTSNLKLAADQCDLILDMSLPTATADIINVAIEGSIPLVCGTTGISETVEEMFNTASKSIAVIHTKNFSVGIAVLSSLASKAAQILGSDWDIEIVEKHHRKKVDAPSGTAQIIADAIKASTPQTDRNIIYGREGKTGNRPLNEIAIHALRGGGIFGEHTVMFASTNERIEIAHKAENRALFAEGAVKTAVFIASAKPGRYTMQDVLGL
jgi:4-hydroxy-tetrahydrodipicolinate reductase